MSDTVLVALIVAAGTGLTALAAIVNAILTQRSNHALAIKQAEAEALRQQREHENLREQQADKFDEYRRGNYRAFLEHIDHYPLIKDSDGNEKKDWEERYRRIFNALVLAGSPEVVEEARKFDNNKDTYAMDEGNNDDFGQLIAAMRQDVYRNASPRIEYVPDQTPTEQ